MPVSTLSLQKARSLAQTLTDPSAKSRLLESVASAEAAGQSTVAVGWLSGPSAAQLNAFMSRLGTDGFAPAGGGGAPMDAPKISPEINDWIESAVANMKGKGTPGTLSQLITEGEARRQRPGVSELEKARLYLTTSGLRMELVQAGKDRRGNATQGFRDLQAAVRLAPDDLIIDRAYGQTMYGMNNVGFMLKKLTELGLGIKLGDETKRAIGLLGAHPEDAEAQVGRQLLARLAGDPGAANAATQALAALPADEVAKARAAYEDAKSTAKKAKDEG